MTNDRPPRNLLDDLAADAPQRRIRARFDELLAAPPRRARRPLAWAAVAAAALALAAGLLLRREGPPAGPAAARTAAVLELLQASSPFQRLRGVVAAAELPAGGRTLHRALVRRLETDSSLNVRLAAIDAVLARDLPAAEVDRLLRALRAQEAPIVQAHLGHQLRRRRLLTAAELARIAAQPGIHEETRKALTGSEEP